MKTICLSQASNTERYSKKKRMIALKVNERRLIIIVKKSAFNVKVIECRQTSYENESDIGLDRKSYGQKLIKVSY